MFPDREGPDDPNLLTNLDDATMNALLRNLIAKLSQKDFPGFNEGDGYIRKELAKKRTPAQEPQARSGPTKASATLRTNWRNCSTSRRKP